MPLQRLLRAPWASAEREDGITSSRSTAVYGSRGERARLFEADPDLIRKVPAALRQRLRDQVTVPVIRLACGRWEPRAAGGMVPSFLVLEGLLCRETQVYGRRAVELLGPGDPLRPIEDTGWSTMQYEPIWRVVLAGRVASLDLSFEAALGRVPGLVIELLDREERRLRMLAFQASVAFLPRLDMRLLGMLWHLADRWGTRRNGTVSLELPLRHQLLADLVGANRSSVTTRLAELREHGLISTQAGGHFLLHGPPPSDLEHLEALLISRLVPVPAT